MNINPVTPVQWAGQDTGSQSLRNRFANNETAKAAETERPVDAMKASVEVPADREEQNRAAPPSALQLKIQELLNAQADQLQEKEQI